MIKINKILFIFLVLLALLDLITTYLGLNFGAIESNPIALYLRNKNAYLPLKIGSILIMAIGLQASFKVNIKPINTTYFLLLLLDCGILLSAVVNNTIVMKGVI